ncbi:MAG: hypothetical protein ABJN62_08010 [Halioglobus sp.]
MQTKASARTASFWLPLLLIVAALVHYFFFLYQHALNVPLGDDIYDVLQVLSEVIKSDDVSTSFEALYAQHNDHRTLASRVLYLATYLSTGEINFRILTFLANLALPLLLALLYFATPKNLPRLLILLPAALLLLQLRSYGITLWSMAAFAYFYVFLYGFASLHCLDSVNPQRFGLACLFAILATFTLASGQVVWVVGLASLLHQAFVRRSASWLYAVTWVAIAAGVLAVWRMGLETPNTLWAMLQQFFITPGHHILYTLTLLGNAVSEKSVGFPALAGALMLIAVLICSIQARHKTDLRLELYCWFILLSVAAMVLGRAPYSTVDYALSSRYSFPSVLMLATVWVTLASRMRITHWKIILLASALAATYSMSSYKIYSAALQPYVEKRVQNFNQGKYWAWTRPMKETNGIVLEAVSLGLYNPPNRPLPKPLLVSPEPRSGSSETMENK